MTVKSFMGFESMLKEGIAVNEGFIDEVSEILNEAKVGGQKGLDLLIECASLCTSAEIQ